MKTEIFGFNAPGNVCQDKKCPFHGEINVKKELLKGTVIKKDVNHSATISWFSPNFLPKYERFESRKSKLRVHNPACLDVPVGTAVVVAKTHPLSKTKHHIILGIVGKGKKEMVAEETAQTARQMKSKKSKDETAEHHTPKEHQSTHNAHKGESA